MNEITLKKETFPSRCEVCHQTDLFDPINNYCQRCVGLAQEYQQIVASKIPESLGTIYRYQVVAEICVITLMVTFLLLGTVLGSLTGNYLDQLIFVGSKGEGGTALGMLPGALIAFFVMIKTAKIFTEKKKQKLVPFLTEKLGAIFNKQSS